MHLLVGNTVSNLVLQSFNKIIQEGHYRPSRNGGCTSIFDATFEVTNPRSRHLNLKGRKSNIFALIAETFWVMAGKDEVNPYLSFFLPRAPDYSDDGVVWAGAYGPRMYEQNQLASMVDLFKRDGLYTRRAVTMIHDMFLDSTEGIKTRFDTEELGKDRPCNLLINFYVEGEDQFITKVIQRSGDIIFGTGSINPFEFSFLHELMYNEVKKLYPDLKLGPYRWHVTNAHLYDFSRSQADVAVDTTSNYDTSLDENDMPIIGPDIYQWQSFFSDIVNLYEDAIKAEDKDIACGKLVAYLGQTFLAYDVPLQGNLLWIYAQLVAHYIASKFNVSLPQEIDISECDIEFKDSVVNSSFLKFELKHD
jgi:thymidylate synthase